MHLGLLTPRRTAAAGLVVAGALFATALGTSAAGTHTAAAGTTRTNCSTSDPCIHEGYVGDVDRGTTPGWLNGRTVTFDYTRNYYCADPPSSGSKTHCEGGAGFQYQPSGQKDPLYVVVPLGFTPAAGTLQCPAGTCIDHPSHIDLSRLFGSSASDSILPAHSHVVATANGGRGEWWGIVIVGVTSQKAWERIVDGKSLAALQACQQAGDCTANVPSNLFLYFAVN